MFVTGQKERGQGDTARKKAKQQPDKELPPHTRHPTKTKHWCVESADRAGDYFYGIGIPP